MRTGRRRPTGEPLSRPVVILAAGDTLASLGLGLVLPLVLIYLHAVRGIPLRVTGALLAAQAATGLLTVPAAGVLMDRFGPRNVKIAALFGQAAGEAGLAWGHSAGTALGPLLLLGATTAAASPAFTTLLAILCQE